MMKIGEQLQLDITHLAGLGDGAATYKGQAVFVPFACADDTVVAEVQRVTKDGIYAKLLKVITPSSQRQVPPCPHFGVCGGCELQHLNPEAYGEFKHGIALRVAQHLGCGAAIVQPLYLAGAASRRRAEAKVAVEEGVVALGFNAPRSHTVIDTPECKVVEPDILAAMNAWRELLQSMKRPSRFKSIQFTVAQNGLDMHVQSEGKFKPADADALQAFAQSQPIARLVLNGQPYRAGEALIAMGAMHIELPVGSFLQATQRSQRFMTEVILRHCEGHARVADLYCGSGTFTLPLAEAGHHVLGFEGGQEAVTALFNTARRHDLPVSVHMRDLMMQPVADELEQVDAVVINPPRNGALPQCKVIAESSVKKVVMVSCNPATFTRDAAVLQAGGFELTELTPIDQFMWSHHLELIGVFAR